MQGNLAMGKIMQGNLATGKTMQGKLAMLYIMQGKLVSLQWETLCKVKKDHPCCNKSCTTIKNKFVKKRILYVLGKGGCANGS